MWRRLCALPYDLNEIHRLAARDPDAFARYWRERERPGRASWPRSSPTASTRGELRTVDPRLTALTVMSNDEGTQNWLRVAGRDGAAGASTAAAEHHAVGAFLADLTVRGLLAAPRDLDRVAAQRRRARRRAPSSPDATAPTTRCSSRQVRETVGVFRYDLRQKQRQPYGARDPTASGGSRGHRRAARRVGPSVRRDRRRGRWPLRGACGVGRRRRAARAAKVDKVTHRVQRVAGLVPARGGRGGRASSRRTASTSKLRYFADYIASLDAMVGGQARRQHADAERHDGGGRRPARSRRSSSSTTTRPATTRSSATSRSRRSPT